LLRECDLAVDLLGDDIDLTYGISYGSMESSGNFEEADVTIPVKGSKSRGSYSYYAVRSGSNIQFDGTLEVDGRTVDIGVCSGARNSGNTGNTNNTGSAGNTRGAGNTDDSLRTYNNTNCSCVVEGEETDRKVSLKLSVDDDAPTGPFQTYYKLGVGDKVFKLATSDVTAPKNLEPTRALEIAIHCASDRVVIGNQKQVTAWSLDDGHELWSTPLERKLNLLGDAPPQKDFSLTCHELKARRGKLKIPTGKSKRIIIDIASGDIKKRKSKKKSK